MNRGAQPARIVRFGIFEADLVAGELRKRGRKVELQDQPFHLLALLLRRPGELVTREELRQALWSTDTFVEFDESLNKAVQKLRQALGDSADNPRFIETLPRKGYRFIAPVEYGGGRPWTVWAAAAALGTVVLVGVAWFTGSTRRTVMVPLKAVALTGFPGWETSPTFSPDGTQVAFSWDGGEQGNTDIYVKPVGGGPPIRLTTDPAGDFSPAWSPDGSSIAFLREKKTRAELLLIPPLGGQERKLSEAQNPVLGPDMYTFGYIAWSPDGKSLVVASRSAPGGSFSLFSLSVATREMRRLTDPPVGSLGDMDPVLSPDGQTLVFIRSPAWGISDLHLLPVTQDLRPVGEPQRLVLPHRAVHHPTWTPDGREVVFAAGELGQKGLWRVAAFAAGAPKPLGLPAEKAVTPQILKGGRRLVYAAVSVAYNLWRMEIPPRENNPPRRMMSSTHWDDEPQYSPDGSRIAFSSYRSGDSEIWTCGPDGSNAVRLTSLEAVSYFPGWFPGGDRIVFSSNKEGSYDVWAIDAEGGAPKRLTTHPANDMYPSVSRDGGSIYFGSNRTGRREVWRMPSDGGEAVQVTRQGGEIPIESADGKHVYYLRASAMPSELWVVPAGGGEEVKVLDSVLNRAFAVRQDGLYFIQFAGQHTGASLRFFSFAGRTSTEIARIERHTEYGLAVSPDGRSVVYPLQEQSNSDLMLVENFR